MTQALLQRRRPTSNDALSHNSALPSSSSSSPTSDTTHDKSSRERDQGTPEKHQNTGGHFPLKLLLCVLLVTALLLSRRTTSGEDAKFTSEAARRRCSNTCLLTVVESIPDNITFLNAPIPLSTFDAWNHIIAGAQQEILIAAYKSSLRGKHVLQHDATFYSQPVCSFIPRIRNLKGDEMFSQIVEKSLRSHVPIKMVENYPPKDRGDNEDGISLEKKGAVKRRYLNMEEISGAGRMHSKFILADRKHFYLGSANLDWRSLNQKLELGVLVENCPCLGEDLRRVFGGYWDLTFPKKKKEVKAVLFNMHDPLPVSIQGSPATTSPRELNAPSRTWDLEAILKGIDESQTFLYIHVMDYFPMFIYKKPKEYWPVIDDAIRRAVTRGVKVRIISAALHYPNLGIRFLRSLQALHQITANASIQAKVFKVPTITGAQTVISRERRTHNKFMVTEKLVIVGTSNWSGDYFVDGSTGAALVIEQTGKRRPFVDELRAIFVRDWDSTYAHPVDEYFSNCVLSNVADYCETVKDPSLFAPQPSH